MLRYTLVLLVLLNCLSPGKAVISAPDPMQTDLCAKDQSIFVVDHRWLSEVGRTFGDNRGSAVSAKMLLSIAELISHSQFLGSWHVQ